MMHRRPWRSTSLFGIFLLGVCILGGTGIGKSAFAAPPKHDPSCPPPEVPTTVMRHVDSAAILAALAKARTNKGDLAFGLEGEAQEKMRAVLEQKSIKTKMEQFFTVLFALQDLSPLKPGVVHEIPGVELRQALILSDVFPDATVPEAIDYIRFRRSSLTPYYEVGFRSSSVSLPLNKGRGFRTWQHGKCQEARAIEFKSPFRFYLSYLKDGNLKVYKFQNADFAGDFGTRGLMDIDLNYVTLVSVVFIRGTPLGYVQARVANKEFEVNDHSWILRVITSFFSDTTKQAIDW